jgi:hypothetical protein
LLPVRILRALHGNAPASPSTRVHVTVPDDPQLPSFPPAHFLMIQSLKSEMRASFNKKTATTLVEAFYLIGIRTGAWYLPDFSILFSTKSGSSPLPIFIIHNFCHSIITFITSHTLTLDYLKIHFNNIPSS